MVTITSHSQEDEETVGLKGVIKKQEFVKIVTSELYSLGYYKTGAQLEEESEIQLHSAELKSFKQLVLNGKWDESLAILPKMGVSDETEKLAAFAILEEKFFEFLHSGNDMGALDTLRKEISPLSVNVNRVKELAAWIALHSDSVNLSIASISDDSDSVIHYNVWDKLKKILPPEMVVPERRLEYLVEQALHLQRKSCLLHNRVDSEMSLYTDHQCDRTLKADEMVDELMNALLHASGCKNNPNSDCPYPKCKFVKRLFYHSQDCTIQASGGCKHCQKTWFMLTFHSQRCKDSNCTIPHCRNLKEHALKLETNEGAT